MDYNGRYYDIYLAESGSRVYKDNRKKCLTKGLKAFSQAFLKALEKALLTKKEKRRYSVDTFVHIYQREHPLERVPCTKTVYQWIDQGLLAIKNIDLPMKTRMRKRKAASKPKGQNTKMLGRSIDLRCESVLSREEFRHWELDLVIGKQTKGEPVIITLLDFKDYYPSQLSGGQQQRIGIARAMALNPDVILFDEPTSSLDPELVGDILEIIKQLADSGITMAIVTHEIGFAYDVSDKIIFMDKGFIIEEGPPHEVIENPKEKRTIEFLEKTYF